MKFSKVIATFIAFVVFLVIFVPIIGIRSDAGMKTPGIFGLIIFVAFIYAIKAIWKKDDTENEN